jgi:hypothetical protein
MRIIFFGEDLNHSPPNPMSTHPESDAARKNFFSFLKGKNIEAFDGMSNTDHGDGFSFNYGNVIYIDGKLTDELEFGIYPISGSKFLRCTTIEGAFLGVEFSAPIAAFGFYGLSMGQRDDQFQLRTSDTSGKTSTFEIMNTIDSPAGSVLYWAIIDTEVPIAKAEFINAKPVGGMAVGFDNFTTATKNQIKRLPVFRCFF